jgi:hypothetical protein
MKRSAKKRSGLVPAGVLVFSLTVSAGCAPVFAGVAELATTAQGSSSPAGFGPLDPTPPSGLPVDQIVQKMGAQESAFAKARDNYTFRQTVRIDATDEGSGGKGEYMQVTDIVFDKSGRRSEHVVFAPQNSLDNANIIMSPTDFDEIEHRLPFVLTTEDLPKYDLKYLGRQRVDDLDTYVFEAGPKTIEKGKHYFQGKVWLDQQDLQIVLINGMTVPQDTRKGHEDLQPPFTTYYEQIDGKYWFPTYTKAEGVLHFQASGGSMSQDVHMRNTVKYTDYKQYHATARIIYNGQDITDQREDQKDQQQQTPPPPKK